MSGSSIGGVIGGIVGTFIPGVGPQLGFAIGSALGGIADPVNVKGPRLSDARQQTSQEGIPIAFGFGTFTCAGNVIWADVLVEHKKKSGGKGGPTQTTYTYTRSYAIGICEGEAWVLKIKRNGKLVYDISDTSTIRAESAKFLAKATIYTGSETQTVDPTIEAVVGASNSGPMRGLAYIVLENDDLTESQGAIASYEFVMQKGGTVTTTGGTPLDTETNTVSSSTHPGADISQARSFGPFNPANTVFVRINGGGAYDAYHAAPSPHTTNWSHVIRSWQSAGVYIDYLTDIVGYSTAADAQAAAQASIAANPLRLTGLTTYKLSTTCSTGFDTAGGMDLTLEEYAGDWTGYYYLGEELEGAYADEDGNIVSDQIATDEIASYTTTAGAIVANLCDRAGLDSSEYDVTALTDTVIGYKCATESTAGAFIEPLMRAFNFDCAEYDKKLRFVKRGGSSVASLTTDDMVAREGAPIKQTRLQEVELLRKVNVMTIDPDAEYSETKQSWERRAGTITALGEATVEIPITTDSDTAAQIAEKIGRSAWGETDKFEFGLSQKYSKLVPTDIVTVTDKQGAAHTLRLSEMYEDSGVFMAEEAVKTRASLYASTATGTTNTNTNTTTSGLVGPTLFAAMNLTQLRTQDGTPGIYIGATGILTNWPGCQILVSYDGGLSYATALTITEPTIMGALTAAITNSGTPLSVHVFGGDLVAASTAQVTAGSNRSVVISSGVSEVLAYEAISESPANYYDLTTLTRGLETTTAASHAIGDQFIDLNTAYFLPISQDYAGDTLHFKAVTLGLTEDATNAVSFVYEGMTYVYDGGAIT